MDQAFLLKLESTGELPGEDRRALLNLASQIRSFGPRHDLIQEGDRPDHILMMVEGWSCRYNLLPDGSRQITAFLVPGDLCDAHITLFGRMDHSIGSLTACKVAFIPRETMLDLLDRPAIAKALWWASLVDEAVLRAWIVNLGRRDSLDRVAHLICEMHARLRHVGLTFGDTFQLPLTQEDLGDTLGITNVHVNRTLRRLRDANIVTLKNKIIEITDLPALHRLAQFSGSYLHLADRDRSAVRAPQT